MYSGTHTPCCASYLAVDSIGFLPSAAEQGPSLVFDVADVDVVAVALPKRDPGAPEHQQVVAVQYDWERQSRETCCCETGLRSATLQLTPHIHGLETL